MSKYAIVLLLSFTVPFLLSFWPPLKFYRNIRSLVLSLSIVIIIFGAWDMFATWRAHWSFNPQMVWPLRLFNLPIEEWLFFVVIPFCCIFTWESIHYIRSKVKAQRLKANPSTALRVDGERNRTIKGKN